MIYQVLWSIWLARNGQVFDPAKSLTFNQLRVLLETLDHVIVVGAATLPGNRHTSFLRAKEVLAMEQFRLMDSVPENLGPLNDVPLSTELKPWAYFCFLTRMDDGCWLGWY